ncbi:MAG: stilbene synthase [Opitutales bacterium]|nr:stilbene synthase [Opitutales bacterium]MCH8540300.1 stilbene synthase [Opitutales bacterium]
MKLLSLQTAIPQNSFTQPECWNILSNSPARKGLRERSWSLLEKVLTKPHGIDRRHFAIENIEDVFTLPPDRLHEEFARHAPALAGKALQQALEESQINPSELDALLICTCTGYLCPGLTSYVAEQNGLRSDAFLQDLVGLGCGAAIPTLRAAEAILARHPGAKVATIAVEICSAAFYLDDDPGVLISACLFSDGAAAAIWEGENGRKEHRHQWRIAGFDTLHIPADREFLRFEYKNGYLRNKLHRSVPEKAAAAVQNLWGRKASSATPHFLVHPGGRDVLDSIATILPESPELLESRKVLAEHGNMSSPSILFALKAFLQNPPSPSPSDLWLTSFGAGFSAHSTHLQKA